MGVSVQFNGDAIKAALHDGAAAGVSAGLEILRSESMNRTPVVTGALVGSCTTDTDDDTLSGVVSYNTVYAVYQHEGIAWQTGAELNHPHGGESKFLENALIDRTAEMTAAIQNAIKGALGG